MLSYDWSSKTSKKQQDERPFWHTHKQKGTCFGVRVDVDRVEQAADPKGTLQMSIGALGEQNARNGIAL